MRKQRMKNFRVEYYDEKSKEMKVVFTDAEDLNEVKSKYKHTSMSVCETKEYKQMLEKYSDIMRPLK